MLMSASRGLYVPVYYNTEYIIQKEHKKVDHFVKLPFHEFVIY